MPTTATPQFEWTSRNFHHGSHTNPDGPRDHSLRSLSIRFREPGAPEAFLPAPVSLFQQMLFSSLQMARPTPPQGTFSVCTSSVQIGHSKDSCQHHFARPKVTVRSLPDIGQITWPAFFKGICRVGTSEDVEGASLFHPARSVR